MSVALEQLPQAVGHACVRLRDELRVLLGADLAALWAYGAAAFPDRPKKLGDVDTHALLAKPPGRRTAEAIDEIHESTAKEYEIEWDSWYVLDTDARGTEPPAHVFRTDTVDDAWALHRAHWLAGRYVLLHGLPPTDVVKPPIWPELREGLEEELAYINRKVQRAEDTSGDAAFSVWNCCRIVYSLETRDVVVSKRTAASWALENLPGPWHEAIRAAGRVYDDDPSDDDAVVLKSALTTIVAETNERFDRSV